MGNSSRAQRSGAGGLKGRKAAQLAAEAFKEAQAKLKEAESWQDKADSEFRLAAADAAKVLHDWPWKAPGHLYDAAKAAAAGAVDEARAVAAFAEYGALEAKALALQIASDVAHAAAKTAALLAKGADKAAQIAGKVADAAARTAQTLEAVAARDSAQASSADSAFKSLAAAYAKQEARKLAKIAKATVRVLKKIGHAVKRVAVAVAKAAYKYSGAQDVVGCVTHPTLAGCAKAALTVALTVGTAGEGEVAEIGLNAAEHAGEDIAEEGAGNALKDAGESCVLGGQSFTAGTKVLLASGQAIPISQLKPGEKVLATNTRTGKTQAETISVVMVHHDTNLYDLKIRTDAGTSVIHTTSNHLFWDSYLKQWIPAAKLRKGESLKTADGRTAAADGGTTPQDHDGWMWDLTVPGNNDHDFYVEPATVLPPTHAGPATIPVLVHNCGGALQAASDAAKAAADDPDSIFIKDKHLASFAGRYAKFATDDIGEAQSWVSEALNSSKAVFKSNALDDTFKVETDLERAVGTKGQTGIRAIVSNDGRVINAFPFNP